MDPGAGDTTTDPPLLISKMTESPSEDSIPNFKSETSNLLWPEGPVRDLNPTTTCSPQRQHLVAGSDHATPPGWEICKRPPGGIINTSGN